MESNDLIATNESKKPSTNTSLCKTLEDASPPRTYLERMMLVVSDSYTASSQTPTLPEKMERAETWSRLLFGVIPEGYLNKCFQAAFEAQSGPFPVSAYDLKNSWVKVKEQIDYEIDALRSRKWQIEDDLRECDYWAKGFNAKYHHCNGSSDHVKCQERYAAGQAAFTFDSAAAKTELAAIVAQIEELQNGTR